MRARVPYLWFVAVLAFGAACAPAKPAGAPVFPAFIPLNLAMGEMPEGIAIDKTGNVYLSMQAWSFQHMAVTDQLWKFTPAGEKSVVVEFPPPGGGRCGLAVDAPGNVYMVRNVLGASPADSGVYKVSRGGTASRLPGTENMSLPNALAFDQRGNLYITEMFSGPPTGPWEPGGIWRIPKGGTAEPWLSHELLTGTIKPLYGFPVGANGIQFYKGSLYVMNVDKMLIVRVPVLQDGSPGAPEVWKEIENVPDQTFGFFPMMNDGLAMDVHGNAYVSATSRCAVLRIDAVTREQTTVAAWPDVPLDAPVNLAFGTGKGDRKSLFVTNMGVAGILDPSRTWPGPGLVKIDVGVAGSPLP